MLYSFFDRISTKSLLRFTEFWTVFYAIHVQFLWSYQYQVTFEIHRLLDCLLCYTCTVSLVVSVPSHFWNSQTFGLSSMLYSFFGRTIRWASLSLGLRILMRWGWLSRCASSGPSCASWSGWGVASTGTSTCAITWLTPAPPPPWSPSSPWRPTHHAFSGKKSKKINVFFSL